MAKRELLMLAHKFDPMKHKIGGWWMSEKLDGHRAFWDGGVTRGMLKENVPWANIEKDERLNTTQISTGLWSRLGNIIHAPSNWLDELPENLTLDGELWISRNTRQELFSIVKKHTPTPEWDRVKFMCFDIPMLSNVTNGEISMGFGVKETIGWRYPAIFDMIGECEARSNVMNRISQSILPQEYDVAELVAFRTLSDLSAEGAEGIMLRDPNLEWTPVRSHGLLKMKKLAFDSGEVIGYVTGRKTDKGSKLLGLMGALVVRLSNGQTLELSGFTENERNLIETEAGDDKYELAFDWAFENPETTCPSWIEADYFPRNTYVKFAYRGLSIDGIPQEARYCRE